MAAFSNPKCYAQELGDCSGRISHEHYVSDAVLRAVSQGESAVRVRNLTFQKSETFERKSIDALTSRILCEKHNSDLSPYDSAGAALFSAMDQIDSQAGRQDANKCIVVVDGDDVERWALKTLCGGLFSGAFPVPEGSLKRVVPPKSWLHILFKGGRFPVGHGLYLRGGIPGQPFSTEPSVLRVCAEFQGGAVIGFTARLFNFQYTLVLTPLPPFMPTSLMHASYRPSGLLVAGSNISIRFDWEHSPVGEQVNVKWLGRTEPE